MPEIKMVYNLNDWPEGHVGHLVPSEEVINAFIEILVASNSLCKYCADVIFILAPITLHLLIAVHCMYNSIQ